MYVCVCVWGKAQTDFFSFLFPCVTCLSNCPPVRPVLIYALFYYHLSLCPRLKQKKNELSNVLLSSYSKKCSTFLPLNTT